LKAFSLQGVRGSYRPVAMPPAILVSGLRPGAKRAPVSSSAFSNSYSLGAFSPTTQQTRVAGYFFFAVPHEYGSAVDPQDTRVGSKHRRAPGTGELGQVQGRAVEEVQEAVVTGRQQPEGPHDAGDPQEVTLARCVRAH
jgi:hypothetical protein